MVMQARIKDTEISTGHFFYYTLLYYFSVYPTGHYRLVKIWWCRLESKIQRYPGTFPLLYSVILFQCVPHWPLQTGKDMVMQARIKDTEISTGHFFFNKNHSTLMRLDNEVSSDKDLGTSISWVIFKISSNNIRIYHECEGGIEKSIPSITILHPEACQMMTNRDL